MNATLIPIYRRLDHAYRGLSDLTAVVRTFLMGDAYSITLEPDAQTGYDFIHAELVQPVPDSVGLLVGDAVHNLRSSLDNLAWQLAHHCPARKGKAPYQRTTFPIHANIREYATAGLDSIQSIRPDVQREIERLQPYHRENPDLDDLLILNKLWNSDKHREISATGGLFISSPVVTTSFVSTLAPPPGAESDVADTEWFEGAFDEKKPIARVSAANPQREFQLPLGIAFKQSGPGRGHAIPAFLFHLHDVIRNDVLPRFDRFCV